MSFPVFIVLYFTLVRSAECQRYPIWLFSVVPWFRALTICCSGNVWMIFRCFSFRCYSWWLSLLFLHSTSAVFLRLLYFRIFLAFFQIIFLSLEIAAYIDMHNRFPLLRIIMSGLLLGIVLSVRTCWFHNMEALLSSSSLFTVSCHRPLHPGTAPAPKAIPTVQASSFRLQNFPYDVWCSKYSCLLCRICKMFSRYGFQMFL